ncbi:MAG: hypothetical protein FIB07_10630 [Candidatus Methanoperedens sp.]|nr:hypothetical protein [Candidatus Methanoperedens sp.]
MKENLPEYPTATLIEIMTELGLYVNKPLAQEIAKRDGAVFYLRKLLQDGKTGAIITMGAVGPHFIEYIYLHLLRTENHSNFYWTEVYDG